MSTKKFLFGLSPKQQTLSRSGGVPMQFFKKLLAGVKKRVKSARSTFPRSRLTIEALEERAMLSATPLLVAQPTLAPVTAAATATDITTLAKQLQAAGKIAKPTGPTLLYLNFDGWTHTPYSDAVNGDNVGAFTGTVRDIQEILYQTAEVFAPFNVEVLQIKGDGVYSTARGATTVFVGVYNGSGITPGDFMDYPSPARGTDHLPNTDPHDIAFVNQDFVSLSTSHVQDLRIVAGIAHEAGHTFGLAHVRTDGVADYPTNAFTGLTYNPDLPPEVMSYDSNDDFFNNTSFNLTEANGTGTNTDLVPKFGDTIFTTQNSFTYLQTVLGARPTTSQVEVADEGINVMSDKTRTLNLVDPGYFNAPSTQGQSVKPLAINTASKVTGTLLRAGDRLAYQLNLVNSGWVPGDALSVTPANGSSVNLLILDETPGDTRATTVVGDAEGNTPVEITPETGHTYVLVVSGAGTSAGAFTLTVGAVKTHLQNNNFTVRDASNNIVGHVTLNTVSGGHINGTFTPNDSGKVSVPVTGNIGGLVNGTSALRFMGGVSTSKTIESTQEVLVVAKTDYTVTFTGQITQTALGFSFSGQGNYKITVTTTTTNPKTHRGYQTTSVRETLGIASGFALVLTRLPGGTVTGTTGTSTTAAAAAAGPVPQSSVAPKPTAAAVDLLMVQVSSTSKNAIDELFTPLTDPLAR